MRAQQQRHQQQVEQMRQQFDAEEVNDQSVYLPTLLVAKHVCR